MAGVASSKVQTHKGKNLSDQAPVTVAYDWVA